MQLMSDALTVLGSRHGLFIEPLQHRASMIRTDEFPGIPCEIKAGVRLNGRSLTLPLTDAGEPFAFLDQDCTPCQMKLTGLDPTTAMKLELTIRVPFRPRDDAFSTTPVLDISLRLLPLSTHFRWTQPAPIAEDGELFLEIAGNALSAVTPVGPDELRWDVTAAAGGGLGAEGEKLPPRQIVQHDAIVAHKGQISGTRVVVPFTAATAAGTALHASWCTWSAPALRVHGALAPFKYAERFAQLDDVVKWARDNPGAIRENATRVDRVFAANNCSRSVNNLHALTLHSWLANTWWVCPPNAPDWFSVWEGSCYYHSTVDVEYTQTPFYLAVWPELLGMELDQWPAFTTDGAGIIGERGRGTAMFMHDMGERCEVDTTRYDHPMPVEENSNYVLMSYAYWRRTGDDTRVLRHAACIEQALAFIAACDTTGNGVPNLGMANTVDDASPAIQFGKEQVYLAVKAMAAFEVGAEMLTHAGQTDRINAFREQAGRIAAVIRQQGWADDHFVTLLDKSAKGVTDSWTGRTYDGDELPGWDAAHVYTANGLALLDMVGREVAIDSERVKTDLRVATERCLDKYGCRHTDYELEEAIEVVGEGGTMKATCRIGWISMNMLRDISAFYRHVDLRALADRYWEFQVLTNTQGPHLFFETFNGNNLMCYPRGVAVFGYFDALAGVRIDNVSGRLDVAPITDDIRVPILLLADWENGTVPTVRDGSLLPAAAMT